MAKRNGLEKQTAIINGFSTTLRNESIRLQKGEENFLESLISRSRQRQEDWAKRAPQTPQKFSHHNPSNTIWSKIDQMKKNGAI